MIRLAKENETERIADIWDVCFEDTKEFIKWNFSRNYSPENTLVYDYKGKICSCMQMMPYNMEFYGETLPIAYISGVSTLPEYRMRGFGSALQEKSLSVMRERNIPVAVLIPTINMNFYLRYGYTAFCQKRIYFIPNRGKFVDEGTRFAELSDETIETLDKIYNTCTSHLNRVIRSKKDWTLILEDIFQNEGGFCKITDGGYALFRKEKKGDRLDILEMLCTDSDAARRLLGGFEDVEMFTAVSPRVEALNEICMMRRTKFLGIIRILDVETVLAIGAKNFKGTLRINITDDNIEENNGAFEISDGTVKRCEDAPVTLDIEDISKLFAGFLPPEKVISAGLENFFGEQKVFLNLML